MRTGLITALAILATTSVAQVLPGTRLPITLKPSELTSDYTPLKLKEQSSGIFGDYYSSYSFQFSSLGIRGNEPRLRALFEILPVSWTLSGMHPVYGQQYVATYILEPSLEQIQAFSEGKPLAEPVLKLKLMKADQIGSIEPYPELTKEKYLAILDELSQKGKGVVNSSAMASALSNAKQTATAMMIYLADSDDIFPYVQSTASLKKELAPYMRNNDLWKTHNPAGAGELRFNMCLAGVSAVDVADPAQTPLLYDPTPFPDGRFLVAFADSSARWLSAEQWKGLEKNLKLKLKRHGKPIKFPG